jgi:2-oxoglutarate dehydrogenase E2 component (dihydrolipoamide succinyltransferase)
MPVDIKVPSVGESISEGTLARWLKTEGALVRQDEPVFELETEKATQEVPAPATGVLHIKAKEGDRLTIGSVVGTIDEKTAAPDTPRKDVPAAPAKPAAEPPAVSPAGRRLAAEQGVDAQQVPPTGRHGVVLKEDVQKYVDQQQAASPRAPAPSVPTTGRETRQRMSAIRARIADRLVAAQKTTASLTTFNEADLSAITELRTRYKDRFKEKHEVGLGFMSFFVKACAAALQAYPVVNARIDGEDVVLQHFCNIGVAVSTEKGLMVPVLRDADKLSFAQVEKAIAGLALKARDGKINVADLQGGTFTITNGGTFGSMLSTPILNTPQSAILGMHAIQKRPVVRDEQIVVRPMMYLALTYDHRLIDGREAVLFLVRVKECLEDPERLLLEV